MRTIRSHVGRLLVLATLVALLAAGVTIATAQHASAISSYRTAFRTQYPAASGSALDSCTLCHTSGSPSQSDLNGYATAYAGHSYSFTAIEGLDSDGDGYTNIAEINALTFPGNAASHPGGATATPVTPTRTNTPPPGSTPTPIPGGTPIPTAVVPPTPTSGPAAHQGLFVGSVDDYPEEHGPAGDWRVSGRPVHVTTATWIEHSELLREHARVWVFGDRRSDGSVDAAYIRVLEGGRDDD